MSTEITCPEKGCLFALNSLTTRFFATMMLRFSPTINKNNHVAGFLYHISPENTRCAQTKIERVFSQFFLSPMNLGHLGELIGQ